MPQAPLVTKRVTGVAILGHPAIDRRLIRCTLLIWCSRPTCLVPPGSSCRLLLATPVKVPD